VSVGWFRLSGQRVLALRQPKLGLSDLATLHSMVPTSIRSGTPSPISRRCARRPSEASRAVG